MQKRKQSAVSKRLMPRDEFLGRGDARLEVVLLPVRDGLSLVRRVA